MGTLDGNIATFVEVVRRRSLAATARHLGVPKSTVSRRLARLEEELDTNLVHRDARRVVPTTEGQRFYDSVVDAVDTLQRAVSGLDESRTEPRGSIRVTAPSDLGRLLLIPRFSSFLEHYPDISLDLIFTNRVVDLAREGVDLALRAGRLTDPQLVARTLLASDMKLAVAPGHPLLAGPSRGLGDIEELARHPFVLHRARARTQKIRLERRVHAVPGSVERAEPLESVELTVSGRVNVDDYAAMVEFVAAGHGIGLMPEVHLVDGVARGRLVPLVPDWGLHTASVHIVFSSRQQPARVRLLIDFLCGTAQRRSSM